MSDTINIAGMEPLRAALRGYGEASKGKPCPICKATGCDHTVLERLRAELLGRIEAFTPSGADCHPESPHASTFKIRTTP